MLLFWPVYFIHQFIFHFDFILFIDFSIEPCIKQNYSPKKRKPGFVIENRKTTHIQSNLII